MFHPKWRLSGAARKLVTSFVALALVMVLVSCGNARTAQDSDSLKSFSAQQVTKIAEVSPPPVIQELRQLLENNQPQVTILSPKPDEVVRDNAVSVKMQVQDLPIFQNSELGMGPHLHLFLDNHSYQAVYDLNEPIVLKDLEPGTHTLRVFASRPWHESFKNEGAYAQTTFHIFTKTDENSPDADRPLLTYSRPQGSYGAEPIMLDFYLTNAPLHVVAQENLEDNIADWKIRATINGQSFLIDRWQPIYLTGFKPGNNWVQLELIDGKGNPINNFFNNTARLLTYEPNGQDALSKLVRGEITSEEARGIVDPNVVTKKVEPIPAPVTEPSVEPTPVPTVEPTTESTVEIKVEVTPVPATESTIEPTVEPTLVPATEPSVEIKVEVTPVPAAESTIEPTIEPTTETSIDATPVTTAEPALEIKVEVTPLSNAEPTVEVTTTPQAQSASEVIPLITPETFESEPTKVSEIKAKEASPAETTSKPIETTEPSPSIFSSFFKLFQRRDTSEVKPLPIPSPVVETPVVQPVTPVVPVPQPKVSPEATIEKKETPVEETKKLDLKEADSSSSLPTIALPETIETKKPELASPKIPVSEPKTESEKTTVEESTKSEEVPPVVEIAPSPNVPLALPEAIAPATSQPETIPEPKVEVKETPVETPTKTTEKEPQPPATTSVIEASTPVVPSTLPETVAKPNIEVKETPVEAATASEKEETEAPAIPSVVEVLAPKLPEAIAPETSRSETVTEPKIEVKETLLDTPTASEEKETEASATSSLVEASNPELPEAIAPATPQLETIVEPKIEVKKALSQEEKESTSEVDSSIQDKTNSSSPAIPLIETTEPLEIPQRYLQKSP